MDSPSAKLPPLLSGIHSPEDLKRLDAERLPELAQEIRETLVTTLAKTGGHLAPNLGVVELCIALHRVFSTPKDKILFDVSHQSYVHKMLTGRAGELETIRQFGGISGFMKRCESAHDAYGAGHAGTALSAGLGIAAARDLEGKDFNVIAVVGDGAFSCGPSLEALNDIATTTKRFIIILNDNEWSIDRNVGSLARYFASLQETETYTWLSDKAKSFIESLGGRKARAQADKLVQAARGLITPLSFFQELGLTYYGPVDGHDTGRLERLLRIVARRKEPCIVHILTEKGRGYAPASENPTKFHGIGKYNVEDGSPASPAKRITYSEAFGKCLATMADRDRSIVAITAAMPSGTRLDIFRAQFPDRFYDVGIAEEHAAIFACGLATQGLKPYLAVYSTFMQRCVDMIEHDAALQRLPVRFCMDRAGLSPDDGPTHHGLFDIAMLRAIPGLVMMQPKDEAELCRMLATMNTLEDAPSAIRYPRGAGEGVSLPDAPEPLPVGKAEILSAPEGADVVLVALGPMNALAADVAKLLHEEGVECARVNARFIKPLDADCLLGLASGCRLMVTMEDHVVTGGFGSAVLELLADAGAATPLLRVGWPDAFVTHGKQEELRTLHGLTPDAIARHILQRLRG